MVSLKTQKSLDNSCGGISEQNQMNEMRENEKKKTTESNSITKDRREWAEFLERKKEKEMKNYGILDGKEEEKTRGRNRRKWTNYERK